MLGNILAAGLAIAGYRPVCAMYSTFLQRAYDPIVHDVALQRLPVVFAIDRGGLVGDDGPTHHGVFDVPYMRLFPNMVSMAPGDEKDVAPMLKFALGHTGPISVRYPKANLETANGSVRASTSILHRPGNAKVISAV